MKSIVCTAGPGIFVPWPKLPAHIRKTVPHLAPKTPVTCDAAKPKLDPHFLHLANQAVQALASRLSHIEQHVAHRNNLVEQGLDPSAIIAAAAQKAALHKAQMYAEKVDRNIQEHYADKREQEEKRLHGEPDAPDFSNEPPPDDRYQHMKLDPSSGASAQKSERFPMGNSNYVTVAEAKKMFEARDAARQAQQRAFEREAATNRAFRARDAALIQNMKQQIERGLKERY